MELAFTPEEQQFREEIRAWVAANLPKDLAHKVHNDLDLTRDDLQGWAKTLGKKGWLAYGWPAEFGGPGWTAVQRHIFEEETTRAGAPGIVPFGPVMVAPVIQAFGTPEQHQRFLPGIASGEVWWSQGYSEPGAGSDLASLKTRAERKGDKYIINGQKTWTTLGQHGDWMFNLVRTSNEGKPQTGISFIVLDMKSPGVTVRPIKMLEGGHEVNDVFFDNVEVPAENLIGEENKGWTYAKHLLSHERTNIAGVARSKRELARLKRIAKAEGVWDDPRLRDQIALLEVDVVALEMLVLRVLSAGHLGQELARHRRPAQDQGQRDPAALHRADDAGRRPLQPALHRGGHGRRLAGRPGRGRRAAGLPRAARWATPCWPPATSTCARPPSTAAATRCSGPSSPRPFSDKPTPRQEYKIMDFNFSDDQQQLRDAVAKWVDKSYDFERRKKIVAAGGFDRAAYDELAGLGLAGMYVSEDHGGLGMGPVEAMVVMEELGRGIVLEPLAQTFAVSAALGAFGTRGDQQPPGCRASPAARPWWCWRSRSARRATGWTCARPRPPRPATATPSPASRTWCPPATRPTPSSCPPSWTASWRCSWSSAPPPAWPRAAT
jgi:alkylation response protein AidB-like acyl-CoA dehydrogenase